MTLEQWCWPQPGIYLFLIFISMIDINYLHHLFQFYRELAVQIHDVFQVLSKYHVHIKSSLFVGGTSVQENTSEYLQHGGQIIVGTPGRIIDIVNRTPDLNFKRLEVLVLDEADKLLDMGFKESINQILSMLPKQRRTGLFSATQTKEVKELARAGLRNPVSVSVRVQHTPHQFASELANKLLGSGPSASGESIVPFSSKPTAQNVPSTLENWYLVREYEHRPYEICKFIQCHLDCKLIIFCATCACVEYYAAVFAQLVKDGKCFAQKNIPVIGFHGKMIAKKRSALYKKFKALPSGIMFSTDVAARGIDIPDVDWIIQMAAPKDPAFFVHRVGRTARAGKKGGALLFITSEEEAYIELLANRGVPLMNGDEVEVDDNDNDAKQQQYHQHFYANQPTAQLAFTSLPSEVEVLKMLKECAKQDRDILESASTAFISFLRAYKEHLCSFIFRLPDLDIGGLARAYGLVRLPKIAETRGVKGKPILFETDPIDTSTIPYKHPEKEKARLKRLKEGKEKVEMEEQLSAVGGKGGQKNNKHDKEKKEWIPAEEFERVDKKRERKRRKSEFSKFQDEWEELAAEETMFKKFKKGKLSKDAYNASLFAENSLETAKEKIKKDAEVDSDGDFSDMSDD